MNDEKGKGPARRVGRALSALPGVSIQPSVCAITTEHPETWPRPRPFSRLNAIFNRLVASLGHEVSMDELSHCSGSLTVHSQVETLRSNYGLVIENRCEWFHDGVQRTCHSYYRLAGRAMPHGCAAGGSDAGEPA